MADRRLTLLAQGPDDLPSLSALLQDSTLRVADIGYDRRRRRLALIVNRYRHEAGTPSRVRAALRIETVLAVQRQNWPRQSDAVLALLSLTHDGGWLTLTFAAGAALRAQVEVLDIVLEDVTAPWPTSHVPDHA